MSILHTEEISTIDRMIMISGTGLEDDKLIDWDNVYIAEDLNHVTNTVYNISIPCNDSIEEDFLTKIAISDSVEDVPEDYTCYFINTLKTKDHKLDFYDTGAFFTLNLKKFNTNTFLIKIFSPKMLPKSSDIFIVLEPIPDNILV